MDIISEGPLLELNADTLLDISTSTLLNLNTSTIVDRNASTLLDLNASFPLEGSAVPGITWDISSWSSSCNTSEPQVIRENFPKPHDVDLARHLDVYEVLQVVLMGLMFVMSLCGNLMVMLVVYLNTFLHSTINYYLVNLAVADLLITVFCWPTIVNRITYPLYLLGRPLCRISVLTQGTCVTVSVLTLATVACDRVYAVLLPIRAHSASSKPLTIIVILWLFSFAVAFPSFYVRDTRVIQWNDLHEESCADFLCSDTHRQIFNYYRILLLATLFFVPGVVMGLAYTLIIYHLWCARRGPSDAASGTSITPEPHARARRKIVKMTAMVLLAFSVCWTPLHALIIYDLSVDYMLPWWFEPALFWAYFLGYSNSALNPLLYGGFSDNFRLGFKKILGRRRRASEQTSGRIRATASSLLSRNPASKRTSTSVSRQTSNSLTHQTSSSVSRQTSNSLSRNPLSPQSSLSLSRVSSGNMNASKHTSSSFSSQEPTRHRQIASQNPDTLSSQQLVNTSEAKEIDSPTQATYDREELGVLSSEGPGECQLDPAIKSDIKTSGNPSQIESGGALEGRNRDQFNHRAEEGGRGQLNSKNKERSKSDVDPMNQGSPLNRGSRDSDTQRRRENFFRASSSDARLVFPDIEEENFVSNGDGIQLEQELTTNSDERLFKELLCLKHNNEQSTKEQLLANNDQQAEKGYGYKQLLEGNLILNNG
ncbi:substance-P receptor-like isoform X1 [Cherax quadricarinatus]|uniref:substance-P receptor-like isoform X1 n=1 Tax=Cherax quadricarinatus TaxID=27406 RepID=UPI00387E7717